MREFRGEEAYQAMVQEVTEAFGKADFPETVRRLDKHFGPLTYSLATLFRDEQRKILRQILGATLAEAEAAYRQVYEHQAPLMRFLTELRSPVPKAFPMAADVALNSALRRAFAEEEPALDRIQALLEEAKTWRVDLDTAGLAYALKLTIERTAEEVVANLPSLRLLQRLEAVVGLARSLPFGVDLWKVQNVYYKLTKLPVAPRTYNSILAYQLPALTEALGKDNEQLQELQSILRP